MADDTVERIVSAHYTAGDLQARVEAAMRAAGLTPGQATVAQLASLDHFHSFGVAGTRELIRMAQVAGDEGVLDVGGGAGGPARLLADQTGCAVTVLDLTPEFCSLGETLTSWTRQSDKVSFVCGNALEMPFDDSAFDVVWTIHAAMNIPDKPRLYSEIYRVLRPGGRFAMFDVLAGPNAPILYPVPWADDPASSFLMDPAELRALLAELGFHEREWAEGAALSQRFPHGALPPVGPGARVEGLSNVLIESLGPERVQNAMRNLQEGRAITGMGVFERL